MGQRAFRGDEISADAYWLRNLKRDLCRRKLLKVEIIIPHLQIVGKKSQEQPNLTAIAYSKMADNIFKNKFLFFQTLFNNRTQPYGSENHAHGLT